MPAGGPAQAPHSHRLTDGSPAVAACLEIPWRRGAGPCLLYRHPIDIELHTIGIRAVRLPTGGVAGHRRRVRHHGGLGRGADPTLRVGDVVIDVPWDAASLPLDYPVSRGRIHTADRPVATAGEKAELFGRTGALAVDMEQSAVRATAGGVPLVGLRAVSDAAGEDLDPAVLGLVGPTGRPRPLAVAAYLARRPGRIASLRGWAGPRIWPPLVSDGRSASSFTAQPSWLASGRELGDARRVGIAGGAGVGIREIGAGELARCRRLRVNGVGSQPRGLVEPRTADAIGGFTRASGFTSASGKRDRWSPPASKTHIGYACRCLGRDDGPV